MAFYQDNNYNFQQVQGKMDFSQPKYVSGSMGDDTLSAGILAAFSTSGYAGEPPLLEELGINFGHIKTKTLLALNPRVSHITNEITNDSDITGPILFCLIFGLCLLLAGKIHFGYIYGVALVGTVSLHLFFKLMSDVSVEFTRTASVLGYCLLPLVPVGFIGIFTPLNNVLGYSLSALSIAWATYSASGFFVAVLKLDNVRPLIAYPLAMFYSVFVLMAVFVEKTV
jgi:mannose/fructose/N-acetylgalactosamine-specific phosphotransferase system component IID